MHSEIVYVTTADAQAWHLFGTWPTDIRAEVTKTHRIPFTLSFNPDHLYYPPSMALHMQLLGRARRPKKAHLSADLVELGYIAPLRRTWPVDCKFLYGDFELPKRHRIVWNAQYQRWQPSDEAFVRLEKVDMPKLDSLFKFCYRMNTLNKGKRNVRNRIGD